MYSEADSYIYGSSESDSSFHCPNCCSKLNQREDVPVKKPSSVKEKIKYFSGSSPLSLQKSFTESEISMFEKREKSQELEPKMYKSRTEICKTANGNLV